MKKLLITALTVGLLLCIVACGERPQNSTTAPATTLPTTVPATAPHTHEYVTQVTEATCDEAGYTTYTCACGESYQDNAVEAKGHSFSEANCTTPKTCTVCAATEGLANGHQDVEGNCAVCGEKVSCYADLKGTWEIMGVRDGQLEHVRIFFDEDGTGGYDILIFVDERIWADDEMEPVIFEDKEYYFAFPQMGRSMNYKVEGNVITCSTFLGWDECSDNEEDSYGEGTIVLERVSGTELKIVSMEGDLGFFYMEPGDLVSTMRGHSFTEPTCTKSATCTLCGVEGEGPKHNYEKGVCKDCGEEQPLDITKGDWYWFDEDENGDDELVHFHFCDDGSVDVTAYYNVLIWEQGTTMPGYSAVHVNGTAYAVKWRNAHLECYDYEIIGNQVFIYWDDVTIILEKIDNQHFKVISGTISVGGYEILRPGCIFVLELED